MNTRSSDQKENKSVGRSDAEKSASQQDKPPLGDLVSSLRSDIPSEAEALPEEKNGLRGLDIRLVVGVIISLVIISLIWVAIVSTGRHYLEGRLAVLTQRAATLTSTITAIPPTATRTRAIPTKTSLATLTPTTTSTRTRTNTPVVALTITPTRTKPIPSSTPEPECLEAQKITLADVGKTTCVQGVVIDTLSEPAYFMVIFSNKKGAFYWVSYDLVWSDAKLNTCYRTTGTIDKIGNSPMLVFGYNNLPGVCP